MHADYLDELRRRTRPWHARIDSGPYARRLLGPQVDHDGYRAELVRLLGFHRPVERWLATVSERFAVATEVEARRRADHLERDLAALGLSAEAIAAVPCCPLPPDLCNEADAFGCLYVLEGSRLGGTVILRHLTARLGVDANHGAAYFTGYGAATASWWATFRSQLLAFVGADMGTPARGDRVASGAIATFRQLAEWLDA